MVLIVQNVQCPAVNFNTKSNENKKSCVDNAHPPAVLALVRKRQEDHLFKVVLRYTMSLSPAWDTIHLAYKSQGEKKKEIGIEKKKRRRRGGETEKSGEYLTHSFKHVVLEMLHITYPSAKGSHPLCHVSLYISHSLSVLTKQKCLSYIFIRLRKQFHSGFTNQLLGNRFDDLTTTFVMAIA